MKKIFYTIILILINYNIFSQKIFNVYLDDTLYLKDERTNLFFDFKDTLPDGIYILYLAHKKDSNILNNSILLKCKFKNNLKEGIYEKAFYSKLVLKDVCNYLNGKKHGSHEKYFIENFDNDKTKTLIFHGEYINGKKDGIFLYFEKTGYIDQVRIYHNDTLINYVQYRLNSYNKIDELKINSNSSYTYINYFYGNILFKIEFFIENGKINKYLLYYNDGDIIVNDNINININFNNPYKIPLKLLYFDEDLCLNKFKFLDYLINDKTSSYYEIFDPN